MIDEIKTLELFGYTSDKLKPHSNKKIWRICDNCESERSIEYRKYTDLCFKCSHKTKEFRSKQAKNNSGKNHPMYDKHHSEETKLKMSIAKNGMYNGDNNPMYGKHHTEEGKHKQTEANSGENNYMYGKYHSEETKRKISKSNSKENHPQWKGGKKMAWARRRSKYRELFSFIPHNIPHDNFHGHHVDFNHVIFIPKELHVSISHSVINNKNMDIINDVVCDWYLEFQGLFELE